MRTGSGYRPVTVAVVLAAFGSIHGNPANRLYIKQNGQVAAAIDTRGSFYIRGAMQGGGGGSGNLVVSQNGTWLYTLCAQDPGDPSRLGTLLMEGAVHERDPDMPVRLSGSFQVRVDGALALEFDGDLAGLHFPGDWVKRFRHRKDARNLTETETGNFIDAVNRMDNLLYPGEFGVAEPAGSGENGMGAVSIWDKAAQIHLKMFEQIHGGPTFLPWHRELLNRMEDDMRAYDPLVSLPYWNWETNPVTTAPYLIRSPALNGDQGWLGQEQGRVGDPFSSLDNQGEFSGSYEESCQSEPHCNPAKPAQILDRAVKSEVDPIPFGIESDSRVLSQPSYGRMRLVLESNAHNAAHGYLCDQGEVTGGRAPVDPMFWLLHVNCDRLWAAWQDRDPARKEAATAYGSELDNPSSPLHGNVEPWSGGLGIRPWAAPDGRQADKSYLDAGILVPRSYE